MPWKPSIGPRSDASYEASPRGSARALIRLSNLRSGTGIRHMMVDGTGYTAALLRRLERGWSGRATESVDELLDNWARALGTDVSAVDVADDVAHFKSDLSNNRLLGDA